MLIRNTDTEAKHPWPETVHVQGGARGVVFRPAASGGAYTTAFVEASPVNGGTFIRGEGQTITEAETRAWEKYRRWEECSDGTGKHGPWESRGYQNGAGFCTKCGSWGSRVLEPSRSYKADELAGRLAVANYGEHVPGSPWFRKIVAYYTQVILALWDQEAYPEPPKNLPSPEEVKAWIDESELEIDASIEAVIDSIATSPEKEES